MSAARFPFKSGAVVPTLTLPGVTRLDLIKYAGASGDFNPIHTIDEAAEAAGLPGVIQHGMLTAAKICRLFSPYSADGFVSLIELRFVAMVGLGDVITITGTVTEARINDETQLARVEVFARNQNNQVVVSGLMEFTAPT
jgi:acyl dehydratase